ncbi:TonB-dependent receptor, partial [bacterium]
MLKIKQCGILFLFVLILPAYAQDSSSLELERITVTKSKVHLLTPYSSAVESLSSTPLDLQSRSPKGGIQTDFSLRGSTFQGVLVLLNGQRINDPQTAHHNSDIPLTKEDIEEVQVIPGAGSSLFGPDAIGGAVNFLVKKPKQRKLTLETGFGLDKNKSQLFSYSDKINNFGMRVSIENKESGGFRYDTDYRKFTTSLASVLDLPCGDFGLNFGYQDKEFGAYDFYTPGKGYPSREWTTTYLIDTGLNLDKEGLKIKPNFLWRRHFDKFALDETKIRSTSLNHHRTDVFTPNIYFQKDMEKLGTLGLGFEYGEENITSSNLGKHNRKHKSVFIDDSKDLTDNLLLGMSYRFDKFDTFGNTDTGSGTLRYSFSDKNSVYTAISASTRVPSFTELYYNDPTTVGDENLSAEKAVNYQVGFDHKVETLSYGFSVFFRQEKDIIDWV